MKMIQRILFRAASALLCVLALSSCWGSEEDEFTNYITINDLKFSVTEAHYRKAQTDGVKLQLRAGDVKLFVFVSQSQVGKTLKLEDFKSDASNYWTIETNDGEADSRTTRSDRGTLMLNYREKDGSLTFTLDMDVVLGHGYAIESHFNGVAKSADNQDIIIDEDKED